MRAVVFPGQGSQRPGMGEKLFHLSSRVRSFYRDASDVLGIDTEALCFRSTPAELTETHNAQIAITVTNLASYELFRETNEPPDLVAGHSVGELSAVAVAGCLSTEDVLRAVAVRAALMASLGPGGAMQAISGCPAVTVEAACSSVTDLGPVGVAVYNTDLQLIVSGCEAAVDEVAHRLRRPGVRATKLAVSHAFHSPLMLPVIGDWRAYLEQLIFDDPAVPVVANVTGEALGDGTAVREALIAQITAPVLWAGSLATIANSGVGTVIEAGEGRYLGRLSRQVSPLLRPVPLLKAVDPQRLAQREWGRRRDAL